MNKIEFKEDLMEQRYVLAFFIKEGQVLLGLKTRKILKGFRNGFGGKYEPGENFSQAVTRECRVECGLWPTDEKLEPTSMLIAKHLKPDGSSDVHIVDIARILEFYGEVIDSDEMEDNRWFAISNLPYAEIHPEKSGWLKDFLDGKDLKIYIEYEVDDKNPTIKIDPPT